MRKLLLALATIAMTTPALAQEFMLRASASEGSFGCEVTFRLINLAPVTLQSYGATISLHRPDGTSLGAKRLRFEYVDPKGHGVEKVRFDQRCKEMPALRLREVSSCIAIGARIPNCLAATEIMANDTTYLPIEFTR